ncbi:Endonuclease/exonuclease/phosphatase [Coprinopsis sp. MPI-PUGE-AT-0042]|nr:Endonuclease/exonuclease/phosphatase [Coprinopsis sp. MPI-PUGE-AT-0042]
MFTLHTAIPGAPDYLIGNREDLCTRRNLSAFKSSNRLWTPVSSSFTPTQVTQQLAHPSRLSLITQNLDAFSSRPVSRAKLLLQSILEKPKRPDIVFLQEVTPDVRTSILGNPNIREAFLVTDAEDQTSFEGIPFANMTLLSSERFAFHLESHKDKDKDTVEGGYKFMLGSVSRISLPSKYGRCALYVDIIPPSGPSTPTTTYRLINVHLDSLQDTLPYRIKQMEILANLLHEPGCGGGLIAGDFNAISPEDHVLLDNNSLVDAWIALHGKEKPGGSTWGEGEKLPDGLKPGRLDKVATLNVEAEKMEVLRPGRIEVPRPSADSLYIPCSDHCGLRICFNLQPPSSSVGPKLLTID